MSPEPTTPTREELLRRIASVFERNGFASWGMLGKEFQDVLREAAEAAEEWAKQHLTSEPAAPSGLTEREANLLRWLPSFLEHAANFLCSDDRAAAMNYAEEARIALKSRLQSAAVPASPAEIEEIAAIIANPERVHIAEYWRENMRKAEAVLAYIKPTASPTPTPAEIEFNQKLKFVLENLTAMTSLYDGCKNKKRGIKYHDDDLVSVHLGDLRKARALLAYIKSAASPKVTTP